MINIFDIKLGNMLPEKFYPIIGEITIADTKNSQVFMYGTCEIPRYDPIERNNYIYIGADYKLVGHKNETNVITINASDIPPSFKYHINAVVEDDDEINRMYLTGTCRGDHEITFDEIGTHMRVIPTQQINIEKNEFKLCDINVWKE